VVSAQVPAVCLEQYRRLAAALHDLQVERGLKVLMVTSALPQDGKTLTALNLAFTLSESYKRRVLLIDADLRRPSLHHLLGLPNDAGLSEVLRSERRDLPTVAVSEHFQVMTAGRTDSSPLAGLTSDRMREMLDRCTEQFDWVLLDAPPVALLPDAQLLGRLTRAVVFVIGAGSTPFPVVERAIAELGPESVVGCVLNRVSESSIPAATYYRGYYHSQKAQR
jgi:capsular exopolysaccharide synthesis family protein